MKKKAIVIIGLFLALATVALVYTVQYLNHSDALPPVVNGHPPVTHITPPLSTGPVMAQKGNVEFEWKLGNPYLLKGGSGDVFLDLRVSGRPLKNAARKPLNLVLVIDRSGSMGSENKLEQVKNAAAAIVSQMSSTDRLAVVIYDDTIQTLIPSSPVENKDYLRERIYELSPGGSTNLCGGMIQGFEEVRRNIRKNYLNRMILLSDGLANIGITEPEQITAQARNIRANSISVSTMGVGVDYNENLMANIADYSGGNYYYIGNDINMATVFEREWNLMQKVIATNARAEFRLAHGVDIVDVAGFKWEKAGSKVTIEIPDIYSGETRRILVQLRGNANAVRTINLADATFRCTDISSGSPAVFATDFHPSINVIEDERIVQANFDQEVNAKAASVTASKKMEEAYRLYEDGKADKAYEAAARANDELKALGYVANEAQVARYEKMVQQMAPGAAPAPTTVAGKDFLKKQKEEERKTQQSNPQ